MGRFILLVSVFGLVAQHGYFVNGLKCWVCNDARNGTECLKKGFEMECENNQICFTELRVENGQFRRTSHCKQRDVCASFSSEEQERCPAFSTSFEGSPDCVGEGCTPRLCRSCCWWEDLCNKPKFIPTRHVAKEPKKLRPGLLIVLPP